MPPVRSSATAQAKRPRPPFKPPRPHNTGEPAAPEGKAPNASKRNKAQQTGRAKAAVNSDRSKGTAGRGAETKQRRRTIALSSDEDSEDGSPDAVSHNTDDDDAHDTTSHRLQGRGQRRGASPPNDNSTDENKPPPIPQKLLTRLLYESFEDKDMKIGREALSVFEKYMETFVREALARAVYERQDADGALGGDGFLQVEDLEKLAPQLLLDF